MLAEGIGELKALAVEFLRGWSFIGADRRVVWYDASTEKAPLAWLQETFRLLNNGLHPEFSFAAKDRGYVPHSPLWVGTRSQLH